MSVMYKLLAISAIILVLLFIVCVLCGLGDRRFFDTLIKWMQAWLGVAATIAAIEWIGFIWTEM